MLAEVAGEMLGLCQRTIGPSIKEVRRLLQDNGISITPTTLCFSSGQEIEDFVRTGHRSPPGSSSHTAWPTRP
ncbi:hypothetical protein [Streptomyces sp. NPDC013187]|uniref:hypothetical protein n=1 Tax=Streptomyces sp. NPDC013187 TaxID=3364865 RepID=UPI0036B33EAF